MHVKHRPKQGKHPDRMLTALRVKSISDPGRYLDGNGLYLVVSETGAKRWMLRTVVSGRRRDIGIGSASLVPLAEAREKATELRRTARDGGDPLVERRLKKGAHLVFREAAAKVHAEYKATWRNAKHAQQWINTIEQYANPILGDLPVDRIGSPEIMRVLSPIWLSKPETARRLRQRLGTVFDWAKASGYRTGDNPIDGVKKGLPKQSDRDVHHAALPYRDVSEFVSLLRREGDGELTRLGLEFLILNASRTGEVLGALKSELDIGTRIWTIPPARMKAGVEHRVPLSGRSIEIVERAMEIAPDSPLLFPSPTSKQKPLSNMAFLATLRRMGKATTVHGFRSSFRDWAAEQTNYPREFAEMALAHTIESKVEAAYRRGDLLEQRRPMMIDWSNFCSPIASLN